jgi:hypothetical protein
MLLIINTKPSKIKSWLSNLTKVSPCLLYNPHNLDWGLLLWQRLFFKSIFNLLVDPLINLRLWTDVMGFSLFGWLWNTIIPCYLKRSELTFNIIQKILNSPGTLCNVVTFFNWIDLAVWFAWFKIPSADFILKFPHRLVFLIPVVFGGTVL